MRLPSSSAKIIKIFEIKIFEIKIFEIKIFEIFE
jgi:hypothetical protein